MAEITIDPERAKALADFRAKEVEIFSTEEDQKNAQEAYQQEVNKSLSEGPSAHTEAPDENIILPQGLLIQRGGSVQKLKEAFKIGVQSIDYGWATSKQLPDGSVIHFPSNCIKR